jgi:hypothetical protein
VLLTVGCPIRQGCRARAVARVQVIPRVSPNLPLPSLCARQLTVPLPIARNYLYQMVLQSSNPTANVQQCQRFEKSPMRIGIIAAIQPSGYKRRRSSSWLRALIPKPHFRLNTVLYLVSQQSAICAIHANTPRIVVLFSPYPIERSCQTEDRRERNATGNSEQTRPQ